MQILQETFFLSHKVTIGYVKEKVFSANFFHRQFLNFKIGTTFVRLFVSCTRLDQISSIAYSHETPCTCIKCSSCSASSFYNVMWQGKLGFYYTRRIIQNIEYFEGMYRIWLQLFPPLLALHTYGRKSEDGGISGLFLLKGKRGKF